MTLLQYAFDSADLLTRLGLRTAPIGTTLTSPIPNYAAHFIIANFLLTYIVGSTRFQKIALGIDNNVSPREDLGPKGEDAVRAGKISQASLDRLRRIQAAHANGMEHFTFLVAALVLAVQSGVSNQTINKYGLLYTVSRAAYAWSYANITSPKASYARSLLWWVNNVLCIRLLWFAGKALNAGKTS